MTKVASSKASDVSKATAGDDNTNENKKIVCGHCTKEIGSSRTKYLSCDTCKNNFHSACGPFSPDEHKIISGRATDTGISWMCRGCKRTMEVIFPKVIAIESKLSEFMETQSSMNERIEERLKALEQRPQPSQQPKSVASSTVVGQALSEINEREERGTVLGPVVVNGIKMVRAFCYATVRF